MAKTDFQMFITTLLLVAPSNLNSLLQDSKSTAKDFSQSMSGSKFHQDAITRAQADLFPNLEKVISDERLQDLRAKTTLRGIFGALSGIIHDQLNGLYGGSTFHPNGDQAARLADKAKALDGVS